MIGNYGKNKELHVNAIPEPSTVVDITYGIVPDQMKVAHVVPLFKADGLSLFTNYRPVSILPT